MRKRQGRVQIIVWRKTMWFEKLAGFGERVGDVYDLYLDLKLGEWFHITSDGALMFDTISEKNQRPEAKHIPFSKWLGVTITPPDGDSIRYTKIIKAEIEPDGPSARGGDARER